MNIASNSTPSFRVLPVAPVDLTLSLPAKSTKLTFANIFLDSSSRSFWCTVIMNTLCERDESAFICVDATVLFVSNTDLKKY
jgi:hypothetical protein